MCKRDPYVNAIYYERKLAHRHLKEMELRMNETVELYGNTVDLSPMIMTMQFYRTRIDTYTHALRLYRKHTKGFLPAPIAPPEMKNALEVKNE
jgi:hypothetical protein